MALDCGGPTCGCSRRSWQTCSCFVITSSSPASSHLIYIYVYIIHLLIPAPHHIPGIYQHKHHQHHITLSNTTLPVPSARSHQHVRPPLIQVQCHNDLRWLFRRRGARTQEARWYVPSPYSPSIISAGRECSQSTAVSCARSGPASD